MSTQHIRLLLVEDERSISEIQTQIIHEITRPEVQIEVDQASSPNEALAAISRNAPDLIVTDLNLVGNQSSDLLLFIKQLRNNVMTFNHKIIVVTGNHPNPDLMDELNDTLRVSDFIEKPFEMGEFQSSVSRRIREILDQRTSSTGLPGRTEGERVLEFAIKQRLEHPDIPTVAVMADLRKIGLAANDRFGRDFGNSIIDRFADDLTEQLEKLYPYPKLEKTAFQLGGDEFAVVLRGQAGTPTNELTRSAQWFARRAGSSFDERVRKMYPEPYRTWGFLHGETVRDKQGRYVLLPLPAARFGIIPFYRDLYRSLSEISVVEGRLHSSIKALHNTVETSANAILSLPAAHYPNYDPRRLEFLREAASEQISIIGSAVETASFTDTATWLDLKRNETEEEEKK